MAVPENLSALISALELDLKAQKSVLDSLGDLPEAEKAKIPFKARAELLETIISKVKEAILPSTCQEWISFNGGAQITCEKPYDHSGQHCKKMQVQSGTNETIVAEVTWIRSPIVRAIP